MPKSATVFVDGATSGNPGPGGWAYLIQVERRNEMIGQGRTTEPVTNNRMELLAAIKGLANTPPDSYVTIHSDSRYVVNAIRRRWYENWQGNSWINARGAPVANRDLWEQLLSEIERHRRVIFTHVRAHTTSQSEAAIGNRRVDAWAHAEAQAARAELRAEAQETM